MAGRIRSIKPELLDDEQCAGLSDEAWRLWVSSWLLADDAGNCRAGDRYLASLVWQDSTRSPRVAAILRELRRAGRIEVYTNGTERYLHVRNWEKHQRIDNAGKPRVPGPDDVNSHTWEPFRGESPRVSASLGDSPLDHRPTTNEKEDLAAAPQPLALEAPQDEPTAADTPAKGKQQPMAYATRAEVLDTIAGASNGLFVACPPGKGGTFKLDRLRRRPDVLEVCRKVGAWLAAGGDWRTAKGQRVDGRNLGTDLDAWIAQAETQPMAQQRTDTQAPQFRVVPAGPAYLPFDPVAARNA